MSTINPQNNWRQAVWAKSYPYLADKESADQRVHFLPKSRSYLMVVLGLELKAVKFKPHLITWSATVSLSSLASLSFLILKTKEIISTSLGCWDSCPMSISILSPGTVELNQPKSIWIRIFGRNEGTFYVMP